MTKQPVMMFSGFILTCCLLLLGANAWADVQWETIKKLQLAEKLLDADVSMDGQNLFILVPGKLMIYSLAESKKKQAIPVNESLDMLKISESTGSVVLLSTSKNTIEIIHLQFTPNFDFSGLPFRGSEKAPITICVFVDYG